MTKAQTEPKVKLFWAYPTWRLMLSTSSNAGQRWRTGSSRFASSFCTLAGWMGAMGDPHNDQWMDGIESFDFSQSDGSRILLASLTKHISCTYRTYILDRNTESVHSAVLLCMRTTKGVATRCLRSKRVLWTQARLAAAMLIMLYTRGMI